MRPPRRQKELDPRRQLQSPRCQLRPSVIATSPIALPSLVRRPRRLASPGASVERRRAAIRPTAPRASDVVPPLLTFVARSPGPNPSSPRRPATCLERISSVVSVTRSAPTDRRLAASYRPPTTTHWTTATSLMTRPIRASRPLTRRGLRNDHHSHLHAFDFAHFCGDILAVSPTSLLHVRRAPHLSRCTIMTSSRPIRVEATGWPVNDRTVQKTL